MHSIAWWPVLALLMTATVTDLYNRRIPNWLVLPFLSAGLIAAAASHGLRGLGAERGRHCIGGRGNGNSLLAPRHGDGRFETMRRGGQLDRPGADGHCAGRNGHRGRGARASLGGMARIVERISGRFARLDFRILGKRHSSPSDLGSRQRSRSYRCPMRRRSPLEQSFRFLQLDQTRE